MARKMKMASNGREIRSTILQYGEAKSKLEESEARLREFFPSMTSDDLARMAGAFAAPTPVKPGPKPGSRPKRRKAAASAKTPKSPVKKKTKTIVKNDEVLRILVKHGSKAISQPDLAKKLGLPSTRFLTPLFVSLSKSGGLKRQETDDGLLWIPVASKIKAYDAQRGGTAFSNGVHLNGASS